LALRSKPESDQASPASAACVSLFGMCSNGSQQVSRKTRFFQITRSLKEKTSRRFSLMLPSLANGLHRVRVNSAVLLLSRLCLFVILRKHCVARGRRIKGSQQVQAFP